MRVVFSEVVFSPQTVTSPIGASIETVNKSLTYDEEILN